ncbi:Transposon Ty3-G Gag-Pol polyprotein [Cucumis melo var. makuwa]|uniref:Transposon Ty3-G Gag-Pol polyprotein n=1 Tax=Cucumis melo var. makuwa TaxID=1194695 RepID=A0A5D3D3P4_CUCMM|nr:Transposon Ty3-G Gag-Pol polyprotein [Cucumis melo var. makuwa]TYK17926.1 Transposon Ty3-G Gag-Pol polyprotein [Cucumis melo var. makuwa]
MGDLAQQDGKFKICNGMLRYKDRLVVSQSSKLIPHILHSYHDSVVGGHSGFLRTYKRIAGELYWQGMKAVIKKYCVECLICQRNKTLCLSPAGLLLPLAIPTQVWSDISMDFVEGLPKAAGFEVIFVVVDWLSKYGHFLALKHPYSAKTVAELFIREVVQLHGFPTSIVSDRDQPKEWIKWISWAEYWYNTTFQRALGMTPFQVVYGRKPPPLLSYGAQVTSNVTLDEQLKEWDEMILSLRENLRIGSVSYKLELPEGLLIHPVFHVSQLKKLMGEHTDVQPTLQQLDESFVWKTYPIEALDYRQTKAGEWEVMVRWDGLPTHGATWERYADMFDKYPDFHLEDKMEVAYLITSLLAGDFKFLRHLGRVSQDDWYERCYNSSRSSEATKPKPSRRSFCLHRSQFVDRPSLFSSLPASSLLSRRLSVAAICRRFFCRDLPMEKPEPRLSLRQSRFHCASVTTYPSRFSLNPNHVRARFTPSSCPSCARLPSRTQLSCPPT